MQPYSLKYRSESLNSTFILRHGWLPVLWHPVNKPLFFLFSNVNRTYNKTTDNAFHYISRECVSFLAHMLCKSCPQCNLWEVLLTRHVINWNAWGDALSTVKFNATWRKLNLTVHVTTAKYIIAVTNKQINTEVFFYLSELAELGGSNCWTFAAITANDKWSITCAFVLLLWQLIQTVAQGKTC